MANRVGPSLLHVVGARPNFMKAAPVIHAFQRRSIHQMLVHTGQHYDANMSKVFFAELGLPAPDIDLGVGSGSHAVQTGEIMKRIEPVLLDHRPDLVFIYGDVNSTVAAALVAVKLGIRVAHVEAGLRSRDLTMPEEINRLVADRISDLLYTPSLDGDENLLGEGVPRDRIRMVGNVMIDTLVRLLPKAHERSAALSVLKGADRFALVTLHRPSNVDDPAHLKGLLKALAEVGRDVAVIFPIHPRTREQIRSNGLQREMDGIRCIEPLGYLDFLALQKDASVIITDSGGIQEESTFLGVPCLTMRENTERPITISLGTNRLIGLDPSVLPGKVREALSEGGRPRVTPPLWDGHAGDRIANDALQYFASPERS